MDLKGYNKINKALHEAGLNATVEPEPASYEDLTFLQIKLEQPIYSSARFPYPSPLKGILENAGLLYDPDANFDPTNQDPQLSAMSIRPDGVQFQDMNDPTSH